jgi:hypothetical protein
MQRRTFISGAGALALPALGLAQVADINDAINKAGRQRMLSQRISKAYLALVHKVEPASAQQIMDRSIALFDRQLVELKAYAPSPAIRETYGRLEAGWSDFKGVLVGSAPSKDLASKVVQGDAAILVLANQGTQQYEQHSGKSVGKLVNIAGRQRMLSQRMAKFYLANALRADPQGVAEIGKARQEFMAALEVLRNAPEATSRIKEEIALADGQWVFFDQGLQRSDASRQQSVKQMADVFIASENLLNAMDRVTGLYSGIAAA